MRLAAHRGWLDGVSPRGSPDLTPGGTPGPAHLRGERPEPRRRDLGRHDRARFSHGYGDARHLPTVLVENHSLKPYHRRVLGTRAPRERARARWRTTAAGARGDRRGPRSPARRGPARLERGRAAGDVRVQGVRWRAPRRSLRRPEVEWLGEPVTSTVPASVGRSRLAGAPAGLLDPRRRGPR